MTANVRTYREHCQASPGSGRSGGLGGRNPAAPLDAPIMGRFENGVGHFYSTDALRGKTIRV
jgi:hypothetical protein